MPGKNPDGKGKKPWWEWPLLVLLLGVLPLGFLSFVLYYNYSTIKTVWEYRLLGEKGQPHQALVLRTYHSPSGPRSVDSYDVKYRYTLPNANGGSSSYEKKVAVDAFIHLMHEEGDSIKILYLPERPWVSNIPDNDGFLLDVFILGILDIILLLVFLHFLRMYRREKREQQAQSSPTPGRDSG